MVFPRQVLEHTLFQFIRGRARLGVVLNQYFEHDGAGALAAIRMKEKTQRFRCHARAGGDFALNSAPTSVPRRHVTEAWYTGPPFDNDKRKLSGMLSGSATLRRTLLREISSTRHC